MALADMNASIEENAQKEEEESGINKAIFTRSYNNY
jgi:hypothetical protein